MDQASALKVNSERPRIAYFCINDPLDKRSWSGITYYLGQSLQRNVGDVDFLGPVPLPWYMDKLLRAVAKGCRILFRKEYNTKHSLIAGLYTASVLKKRMRKKQYDYIVAPAAATELSCLNTRIPIVYVSDTTFALISEFYKKDYNNLLGFSKWEGNFLEKRALRKSTLVVLSSHWAAHSAKTHYQVPINKLVVMPLGANMDIIPDKDVLFKKIENKTLTLLYLAVEWERKGGQIAFDTLLALHARGINAKLVVCGCHPPEEIRHPQMEVIPFLNKNNPADHNQFIELLTSSHFLLLPTRADCSLLVACESNAYGMPAISTNTGGVSDVIKDGINGYCLPYEEGGSAYAALIAEIYSDNERYKQLIINSRKRFEETLNWDVWAYQFKNKWGASLHNYTNTDLKETYYPSGVL